ncbi:MAG: UPF0149 family protein [Thermoanaerobaculia bacterium]|nr:UPF0149 family protein [Thermoanaerobaculia bacterium]
MQTPAPLTPADREALEAFLAEHGTLRSYHELQGFFFAILGCPELVRPPEWLELLYEPEEGAFESLEEATRILGLFQTVYNGVAAAIMERDTTDPFPADCPFRDNPLANFDEDAPVAQWSRAFVATHALLVDRWDKDLLDDDLAYDLEAAILTLAFFSSTDFADSALAMAHEIPAEGESPSLETLARWVRDEVPIAAYNYANIGRELEPMQAGAEPPPRVPPRSVSHVGRNQPCPCGSGKKYKRCCGASAR